MTTLSLLTAQGISALKAGDKEQAQKWLRLAVKRNPDDITAWLWLSGAVDSDQERLECLQQVLRIDPKNEAANKGISKLQARKATKPESSSVHEMVTQPVLEQPKVQPFIDPENDIQPVPQIPKKKRVSPFTLEGQKERRVREREIYSLRPSLIPLVFSAIFSVGLLAIAAMFLTTMDFGMDSLSMISGVVFGVLFLILLLVIFRTLLRFSSSTYKLTTRNVVAHTGLFARSKVTIPIHKIRHVNHNARFPWRLFGIGDVIVDVGSGRDQIQFKTISQCEKRAKQILQVIEHYS